MYNCGSAVKLILQSVFTDSLIGVPLELFIQTFVVTGLETRVPQLLGLNQCRVLTHVLGRERLATTL